MSKYRNHLPQLREQLVMLDAGMETYLVFHEGIELPAFASCTLLDSAEGRARLQHWYMRFIALAAAHQLPLVLEAPTWRANPDWGPQLGYDAAALERLNRAGIELLEGLRQAHEVPGREIVIAGVVGPRGDGYVVDRRMSAAVAADYHRAQLAVFADSAADMAAGYTLNYVEEGMGIALAAKDGDLPVALSFTLETDGKLPSGQPLGEAIEQCDRLTGSYPAYYMINCAHPEHFQDQLRGGEAWVQRIRGLRANASRLSHAELDSCTELDVGDPLDLAQHYRQLRQWLPQLSVVGGCCGTDHRHVGAICAAISEAA